MKNLEEILKQIRFIICDVDGVLTDSKIWFDAEGRPFRAMNVNDGTGLTLWHMAGGKSALVSGLGSKAVEIVAKQWKCTEVHTYIKDKADKCREISERHNIPLENIAFIGDDIIDIRAMNSVGLAVAVADAAEETKRAAKVVTEKVGGEGAVRELVELILKTQGKFEDAVADYCSRKNGPQ